MNTPVGGKLTQFAVPLELRLAGLWTARMFCYVYGDLLSFYVPGRIEATAAGDLGPLGTVSPGILVGIAVFMAIPAVMIALSLHLTARPNRLLNLTFGAAYTLIIVATLPGAPPYYWLLAVVDVALTGAIVWQAWRWPRGL